VAWQLLYSGAMTLQDQVSGKVVVITGGSSGIGLATARKVAAAGAVTIICGRDQEKLEQAAREIGAIGYQVDLSDLAACDRFAETLLANHGGADVLINNAGRSIRRGVERSLERFHDFERTMKLNYFGALRLTMALLPSMVERGRGHIINISSIGVLTSEPRFSAYLASKAAFDAWTRCAAGEYAGSGVRFTTVNMPLVDTPMVAPIFNAGDMLTPEQAADLIADAVVRQPVRIATGRGQLAELFHALFPRAAERLRHLSFRQLPESASF
jgi:NAD(P)-dependent dehydrogenase (short-subunit alcohol dehydrogenase family)